MKSPKKQQKTAEQVATENRNRSLLDETIMENEKKFKALARGTLGRRSFLSGAATTRGGNANRSTSKPSMLGVRSASAQAGISARLGEKNTGGGL